MGRRPNSGRFFQRKAGPTTTYYYRTLPGFACLLGCFNPNGPWVDTCWTPELLLAWVSKTGKDSGREITEEECPCVGRPIASETLVRLTSKKA